jgi:TM2 domain-containing membrane protein YozV
MQDSTIDTATADDEKVNSDKPVVAVQPAGRHFLAVFFISFMWGMFGVDRFYLGKIWTGILKLITFGGFGLWTIIDMVLIMSGAMRDKQGNEMLQAARYKKFAARTVIWFAVILGAFILINGILAIVGIYSLITAVQDGSMQNLLPAGVIPDTNQIQGILNQP